MADRAQILLRVPTGLKDRVTAQAAADGLSVNAWAARALLVALGDPPAGARGLPAAQASAPPAAGGTETLGKAPER